MQKNFQIIGFLFKTYAERRAPWAPGSKGFSVSKPKNYVSFLLLASCVLFTAQCGPGRNQPSPTQVDAATVYWITWEVSSPAEETLMEQFQEEYPHVEFERKGMDRPIVELLGNTPPPDLFNIDADRGFQQLVRQNQLADVTELWVQSGLQEQVPVGLQKVTEQDGKQFYVPLGFGWAGFYYNKQIFDDYGLTPPETWDEFLQICDTLQANDETPLSIGSGEAWLSYLWFEYLDLRMNGPAFHRALLTGRERYDDLRVRNVLETWQSLFDRGYFVENPQLMGELDIVTALIRNERARELTREKAVMTLTETYNTGQVPALFMEELGFFRFPLMDPEVPVAEVVYPFGYAVPMSANHLPQAMAFLHYLSGAEAQAIIAQKGLYAGITFAPARRDVDQSLLRADQQQALTLLDESAEVVPHMWLALPGTVWGGISSQFTSFVRGPRDIDRFLEVAETARARGIASGELTQE